MRIIITILFFSFFALTTIAQSNYLEIKGGINYNGYKDLSSSGYRLESDFQFRPDFSILINKNPNDYVGYSFGIGYHNKTTYYDNAFSNHNIDEWNRYYLKIPLLLNVSLIQESKIQLISGISFDYLMKSTRFKSQNNPTITKPDVLEKFDLSKLKLLERMNYSFIIGLNIKLLELNDVHVRLNPLVHISTGSHINLIANLAVAFPI